MRRNHRIVVAVVGAFVISGVVRWTWSGPAEGARALAVETEAAAGAADTDLNALKAEIEQLKKLVERQACAMSDVDYHATNLWFAARAGNWPLADFYWRQTLLHMQCAGRTSVSKQDDQMDETLDDILRSLEKVPQMRVGEVLKERNLIKFEKSYRFLLEGCYACHKAAGLPYLRPRYPTPPIVSIMNFDPNANWPK